MAVVRFTATRSLAAGTTLNDVVTLNLALAAPGGLTRNRVPSKSTRVTISRIREVTYYGVDKNWQVNTIPLRGLNADKIRMFLDSCERGEVFLFSAYQVVGDTYVWTNSMLESEGFSENRVEHVDGASKGSADYFSYSFSILEVA